MNRFRSSVLPLCWFSRLSEAALVGAAQRAACQELMPGAKPQPSAELSHEWVAWFGGSGASCNQEGPGGSKPQAGRVRGEDARQEKAQRGSHRGKSQGSAPPERVLSLQLSLHVRAASLRAMDDLSNSAIASCGARYWTSLTIAQG